MENIYDCNLSITTVLSLLPLRISETLPPALFTSDRVRDADAEQSSSQRDCVTSKFEPTTGAVLTKGRKTENVHGRTSHIECSQQCKFAVTAKQLVKSSIFSSKPETLP